jgi:hypothetical protein
VPGVKGVSPTQQFHLLGAFARVERVVYYEHVNPIFTGRFVEQPVDYRRGEHGREPEPKDISMSSVTGLTDVCTRSSFSADCFLLALKLNE